jgi:hypothetical protein
VTITDIREVNWIGFSAWAFGQKLHGRHGALPVVSSA